MEGTEIDKKNNCVLIKVNPKIYPLPVVYQAAEVFIDKCFVFLDGDPEKEIKVFLKPKEGSTDLKALSGEFNNELLNYSALITRAMMNKELRELIVKRAFFTVTGSEDKEKEEKFEEKLAEKEKIDIGARVPIVGSESQENIEEMKEEFDLEEIAKPWEEQKGAIKEPVEKILKEVEKEEKQQEDSTEAC